MTFPTASLRGSATPRESFTCANDNVFAVVGHDVAMVCKTHRPPKTSTTFSRIATTLHRDTIGNLSRRVDHKEGTTESFCYDDDNRLTSYGLTTATACPVTAAGAVTMSYSSQGNLTSRSDVGTYAYGAGTVGSHAVTSITGTVDGIVNPSFLYDANGNMRCMTPDGACDSTAGLVIQWNSFNMASHVRDNPRGVNFDIVYDTNHARLKRCSTNCTTNPQSTTLYLNDPATGTMEEAAIAGGTTTWTDYIAASGGIVAIRNSSGGTPSYLYVTGDHLGSVSLISDASGGLIAGGRQSYDPWGQRRNPDGTPASSCSAISSATTRGYTGQEEMDSGCLVNLNGRIYYPVIGRMLSADPTIPDPLNTQSYNRYSYVNNNPLNAIDPSGYVPCLSCQDGSMFGYTIIYDMKDFLKPLTDLIGALAGLDNALFQFIWSPGASTLNPGIGNPASASVVGNAAGSQVADVGGLQMGLGSSTDGQGEAWTASQSPYEERNLDTGQLIASGELQTYGWDNADTNGGSGNGCDEYCGGLSPTPTAGKAFTIPLQNRNWVVTITQERMQHVLQEHGYGRANPNKGEYSQAVSNQLALLAVAAMTIDLGSTVGSGNSPNSITMEYTFPGPVGTTGSYQGQANVPTANNMVVLQQTGPGAYTLVTQYPVRF